MIFGIDRVQFIERSNSYLITEFLEINGLEDIIRKFNERSLQLCHVYKLLNKVDSEKLKFLLKYCPNTNIILYSDDNNEMLKIYYDEKWLIAKYTFNKLSNEFKEINNSNGSYSKKLGAAKEDNYDSFINTIIGTLYNIPDYKDDCGLKLTKKLLGTDPTKGFDLDLFQYIPSTKQYIFYEFLKREAKGVSNITAHPMRYCWTGYSMDNRKKFISLWKIAQAYKGKLILINYSDNQDEDISLIEVTNLDENLGIRSEIKYVMNYHEFIGWLNYMNTYNKSNTNYLDHFKSIVYDEEFFDNWKENKHKYGTI